jgi:hypothetical protein
VWFIGTARRRESRLAGVVPALLGPQHPPAQPARSSARAAPSTAVGAPASSPPARPTARKLQRFDLAALVQPRHRLDDAFPIQPLNALPLLGQLADGQPV